MAQLVMQEMHSITLKINTTPSSTATMSELRQGIENFDEALNEVVNDFFFMADQGYGRSRVSAMAPAVTVTGRRIWGDAAQDYIFGGDQKYGLGAARETDFTITYTANGYDYTISGDCCFANIQELSGATENVSAISVELRFNGKPTATKTTHST
ncbi:MAG: hypothetical protein J6S60_04020 [Oscillospiraceae bacterium]|nr:hypothetical protein [Oscillospiraceae bacterium]